MFNDKNTVIYGHYMKDKTMFGQLKNYKNEDFFNKNKIISISTPKGNNLKSFSEYLPALPGRRL